MAQSPRVAGPRSTASWVVYDMANTIFSFGIVSLFFPLYLQDRFGLPDAAFAVASSASIVVMLVLSPVLGALSDGARRRVPFLVVSTVACVAATIPLGLVPWQTALVLFGIANIGFLSGLVIYDTLLPVVSTPQNRGRIGAIGVGIGYLGSLIGLAVGRLILSGNEERDPLVFAAIGGLFLLLALPAFFWIVEPVRYAAKLRAADVAAAVRRSYDGLRNVLRGRDAPGAGAFLVARLFYSDAVNTMILFMGIYVRGELDMTPGQVSLVLLLGILGAAAAAPLWGILVDRIGARRTLSLVLTAWMLGLAVAALIPLADWPSSIFFGLGAFLGACLAGSWSADRPLLVELAPHNRVGEFFGYYGMVGRFSAIAGPLLWALVVDAIGWGRPAAVLTLLVVVGIGMVMLRRVDAARARPTAA